MFNYFLIKLVYFLQMLSCASSLVNSEMAFSFNFCQVFGLCMYIVQKLPHKYQLTISISLVCLHAAGFTYKTPIYSVFLKYFFWRLCPNVCHLVLHSLLVVWGKLPSTGVAWELLPFLSQVLGWVRPRQGFGWKTFRDFKNGFWSEVEFIFFYSM